MLPAEVSVIGTGRNFDMVLAMLILDVAIPCVSHCSHHTAWIVESSSR